MPIVLAVAATDYDDIRTSYSCFGPEVDVAAPGESVLSLVPTWYWGPDYLPYAFGYGTSASAPHVAGLAALLKGLKPWLTASEIMDVIRFSSDDVNSGEHSGKDDYHRLWAHQHGEGARSDQALEVTGDARLSPHQEPGHYRRPGNPFSDAGFTILTGETGAGKSIIIDGIKLVLGDKAAADLIRTGKDEGHGRGRFPPPPAQRHSAGDSLRTRRARSISRGHITQEGTGKAYLNGVLVPARKLREVGPFLVDVYGQNDHIFLLQIENHLRYLDDFLGLGDLREEVTCLAQDLRRLSRQKEELQVKQREREQRLDFLDFQIKEIEAAGLRAGEWEELLAERNILKNSEKIARLVEAGLSCAYSRRGLGFGRPLQAQRSRPRAGPVRPGLRRCLKNRSASPRSPCGNWRDALIKVKDTAEPRPGEARGAGGPAEPIEKLQTQVRRDGRRHPPPSGGGQAGVPRPRPERGEARPTSTPRSAGPSRVTRTRPKSSPVCGSTGPPSSRTRWKKRSPSWACARPGSRCNLRNAAAELARPGNGPGDWASTKSSS